MAGWERGVANARVHGTTGEAPMVRFARDEMAALQPLADRPSFQACRTLERRVKNDCAVEVDGNACSVPLQGLLALEGKTTSWTRRLAPTSRRARPWRCCASARSRALGGLLTAALPGTDRVSCWRAMTTGASTWP